jgi:isoamylase
LTESVHPHPVRAGSRFPPGATLTDRGVNFCVFSRHATAVELLLYARADSETPYQIVNLDPERHRTSFFWHVFVEGVTEGTLYTWRVDGPGDTPRSGWRFNPHRELLDPWARAVSDAIWERDRVVDPQDPTHHTLRAVVTRQPDPPRHGRVPGDLEGAVIYEVHLGGFTRHPSAEVEHPGTFAGLMEKIPYLRELGVTHVELLPVMAFDSRDVPRGVAARGLSNFWGYSTHSFWAPHPGYCVDPARGAWEFQSMVDALHAAGIGVLMDVVFNHTAEGGDGGPTIHFKGLANDIFYHLDAADRRRYLDFTGCGNTVNCNHPLVSTFIVRCLEYWVDTLGVDGFRFDLACVFTRGDHGAPLANPPLPWLIEASPTIAPLPAIAEAWDAAGLYQVGAFPGMAWKEWNGRFRDTMRCFARGDPGLISEVATRIAGSADLYADDGRRPDSSINFITCHDGFTLRDLVSYNGKHNEANGEDNRDGGNDNLSWNCGAEGETGDPAVVALRSRQAKNLLALLMLSRGVPMLLAGDEVSRTQHGNNNAWCQDSEIGWFDWRLTEQNADMLRYTRELIALRRRHPSLTANRFFSGAPLPGRDRPDVVWHGTRLNEPLWQDPQARVLACTITGHSEDEADLHVILNMSDQALDAPLPGALGRQWHVALDTASASPRDIVRPAEQSAAEGDHYLAQPRSVIVLEAR